MAAEVKPIGSETLWKELRSQWPSPLACEGQADRGEFQARLAQLN